MIDISKEKNLERRFKVMCQKISNVIRTVRPDHVVFEQVSMQTNASTLITLARIQGAIMQTLYEQDIAFTIYSPSSWRKLLKFTQGCGITRKELKQQALDYVRSNYQIETTEDTAEAICIGSAFLIDPNKKDEE